MLTEIKTIEDVLPHISEDNGIIVSKRPDHSIIDYVFTNDDTFGSDMAMQCRGLKFDIEGRIIARPFHKFFNLGEREDPLKVDWTRPHHIVDKLDGTMVHGTLLNGELVLMTRMGVTEQARDAMAVANDGLLGLCETEITQGRTPIFEYTSPENRIVVEYDKPAITLLAVREMVSGRYLSRDELVLLGDHHGVPVVQHHAPISDIKSFVSDTRALEGVEDYVIAFDDGHKIKIKADGYVLRHRALSNVQLEKNVLAWIVGNAVDDVLPLLSNDIADQVQVYQADVQASISRRVGEVSRFYDAHKHLDRREFAEAAKLSLDKTLTSAAFGMLDGKDARGMVIKHLTWASNTQNRIDDVRPLYGFNWSANGLSELESG